MRRQAHLTNLPRGAAVLALIAAGCFSPPPAEHTSQAQSALSYDPLANGDHWGCDTDNQPPLNWIIDSYSDHGACCDSHDACMDTVPGCYGDYGHWQTALSCYLGYQVAGCNDACIQCHLGVMSCLSGPATGISACVGYGNCGDPRRADNPFGCTGDQMCRVTAGPYSRCNLDNGNCETFQMCPPDGCYNAFQGRCYSPSDCGPGMVLDAGSCTCVPGTTCTPCLGQSCGTDLSCGTGWSCGSCSNGYTCNAYGNCEQVTTCVAFCGNGVCECSEPDYCPQDCGGGGGGGGGGCDDGGDGYGGCFKTPL
jgi:hypothetical protein